MHPLLFQVVAAHPSAHLVLLILASVFLGLSALGVPSPNNPPWPLNWMGLGLFCWSLSWFV